VPGKAFLALLLEPFAMLFNLLSGSAAIETAPRWHRAA